MKIDAYKCDACGTIFEGISRAPGVMVRLNLNLRYESISEPPLWKYEHVCDSCRTLLREFLKAHGWIPTEPVEVETIPLPTPAVSRRDVDTTEEPF